MTEQAVREIVSRLTRSEPGKLTETTGLVGSLGGSIGFAKLDAALRSKFGISNPKIYAAGTYGDLCRILGVGSLPDTAPPQAGPAPLVTSLAATAASKDMLVGVDVELVSAMHSAADYREDEFYKSTFVPQEIAHALLQASPQASFAAMWCAKEALRKADASLAHAPWQSLEVARDVQGKPFLKVNGQAIGGALSLSHTDEIAFAVYVALQQPQLQPVTPADSLPPPPMLPIRSQGSNRAAVISGLALLVSILALLTAILHH